MTERTCLEMEIAAIEAAIFDLYGDNPIRVGPILNRITQLPTPIADVLLRRVKAAVSIPRQSVGSA
jgi:hypothetical protein